MWSWLRHRASSSSQQLPTGRLAEHLAIRLGKDPVSVTLERRLYELSELDKAEQERLLPTLYLHCERYLTDICLAPADADSLRRQIRTDFPEVTEIRAFRPLLASTEDQELLVCEFLLETVFERGIGLLGSTDASVFLGAIDWIKRTDGRSVALPFGLDLPVDMAPLTTLTVVAGAAHRRLSATLGPRLADRVFDGAFQFLSETYPRLEALSACVQLLPDSLLDEEKIALLSQRHTRQVMIDKIESLEAARLKAEAADQVKTTFLANLSHELRTPMHAIIGLGSMLLEDEESPERQHQLSTLLDSGQGLLHLIEDILDFSRQDSGQLKVTKESIDLAECAGSAVDLMHPQAAAAGLELHWAIDPACPRYIEADASRLRQVLVNLLGNAIKFTEQGSVRLLVDTVEAERASSPAVSGSDEKLGRVEVRFRIVDSGIGIAQDKLEKIFEPFEQADTATARGRQGAGLGLSISRQLIKAMGGRLTASSTYGEGSEFILLLSSPRNLSPPAPTADVGHLPGSSPLRILDVLVVDDHPINREVATVQLQKLGHRARQASGGQDALDKLQECPADVVLLDIQMPVMDGFATCCRLRSDPERYGRPTIVMMSASLSEEDRERGRLFGADGDLAKPVTIGGLRRYLDRLAENIDDNDGGNRSGSDPKVESTAVETSPRATNSPGEPTSGSESQDRLSEFDWVRLDKMKSWLPAERWLTLREIFLSSCRQSLEQMRQALEDGDLEQLSFLAHRMKGSLGSFGAENLVHLCEELEAACGENDLAAAKICTQSIEQAWPKVELAVARSSKALAPSA